MALTVTEVASTDIPCSMRSGSAGAGKRRKLIMLRLTNTVVGDKYDVAGTAVLNAADIEGQIYHTLSNAACGTAMVWSTTTLQFTGQRAGAHEIGVVVNLT